MHPYRTPDVPPATVDVPPRASSSVDKLAARALYELRGILAAACLAAACAALAGCPKPTPGPVPPPDSGDAASLPTCVTACANLRTIGCPEGYGSSDSMVSCEQTCQHVVDTHLTRLDLACMTAATSTEAARACAGLQNACQK